MQRSKAIISVKPSVLLVPYINIKNNMINNITKYFSPSAGASVSKGPLSKVNNVKLQYQKIASINSILATFFRKFYILISKPVYTITPNGIKISILYFLPKSPSASGSKKKGKGRAIEKRNSQLKLQKAYWEKLANNLTAANANNLDSAVSLAANTVESGFSRSRLTFLVLLLSKMLRTNVQLELVRLKYVYHDSNILAQFLGINSHRSTYGQFKNLLWRRVSTNSNLTNNQHKDTANVEGLNSSINPLTINDTSPVTQLTGFKIKISGRLAKQRVVPKKTVKTTYKGAISPNKYNLVEQATFTGKNKKGAYSIRVWTSHGTTPNLTK